MIERKKRGKGVIYCQTLNLFLVFVFCSRTNHHHHLHNYQHFPSKRKTCMKEMEKESKKRLREGEDARESTETSNKAKKQHISNKENINLGESKSEEDSFKALSDNYLALGVFDFPWLKEGMISKSDDWKLEDTFSSSLNTTEGVEFYGQRLCETPESVLVDFPDERFDLRVVEGDHGLDGVDCFWSSLLNQPLSPGVFN